MTVLIIITLWILPSKSFKTKTKKLDPFIISIPDNWYDDMQKMKDDTKLDFDAKVSGEYIKTFTKTLEDFHAYKII